MCLSPIQAGLELPIQGEPEVEVLASRTDRRDCQAANCLCVHARREAELELIVDVGQLEPVTPVDVTSRGHLFVEDHRGPLHDQGTSGLEEGVQGAVIRADVEARRGGDQKVFDIRTGNEDIL